MTSPDRVAQAQEAIWEASELHGVRLQVSEQVAIARDLAQIAAGVHTPDEVKNAFLRAGAPEPSKGFARDVLSRIRADTEPRPSLLDVVLKFRRDAVRTLSRQYGGKAKKESELRDHLLMYLPQRGYAEAHTGRGQTDLLLPKPDHAIIETKVWTTPQIFEDGVVELGEYVRTEQPDQAIYVIFGDSDPLPTLVDDQQQELAGVRDLGGLKVPVVVVLFDVTPPSKVAQTRRRESRGR